MSAGKSIVMIGATGAVGTHVVNTLINMDAISQITLLGRRPLDNVTSDKITQHSVDVMDPEQYNEFLAGHSVAISTMGVGEPSKMSREQSVKIDKDANLNFGLACEMAGIQHFQLLSSVGVDPKSSSFFLRNKGELEDGLKAMGFNRLSLFHPSMILTPENRYGISQGITLLVWPLLKPFLIGPLRKLRGVQVAQLGASIAKNVCLPTSNSVEVLEWDDFQKASQSERG